MRKLKPWEAKAPGGDSGLSDAHSASRTNNKVGCLCEFRSLSLSSASWVELLGVIKAPRERKCVAGAAALCACRAVVPRLRLSRLVFRLF
jgi:hypothetical protein